MRKDNSTFRIEISTSFITFKGKSVIQGVLRDVTEQERLEHQLQQSQRMKAIGTLAGGIPVVLPMISTTCLWGSRGTPLSCS
ncbi:MAG: hypothetical protein U9R17_16700 [Thermodesulfobacteriota bacterium]|nr:hypothetical protein [Thermodesulfobacteriota bacterium]